MLEPRWRETSRPAAISKPMKARLMTNERAARSASRGAGGTSPMISSSSGTGSGNQAWISRTTPTTASASGLSAVAPTVTRERDRPDQRPGRAQPQEHPRQQPEDRPDPVADHPRG